MNLALWCFTTSPAICSTLLPFHRRIAGKQVYVPPLLQVACDFKLLMKVAPCYDDTFEVQQLKSRQRFAPPAPAVRKGKWGQQQLELFWTGSLEAAVGKRELSTGNMCSFSGNKKSKAKVTVRENRFLFVIRSDCV